MEKPAFTTIEVDADGQLGRITLNRPDKLNPLGTLTLRELIEAAGWLDAQEQVKVVVVAGRGRAFSAGADLAAFDGSGTDQAGGGVAAARQGADAGRLMAEAVETMAAVTVARIGGHCVGGALVLAAACDLRVAADTASFSIPELALGIPLAWGGIPRLVREIGPALTKELVMTCRVFGPEEARAAGFLNRVVPEADLDAAVEELVSQLLARSSLTLRATKAHVNAVTEGMVGTARAWNDADSLVSAQRDPESREVAAAYLESRRRRSS
ncbi:MAG TPA: enoyl-CoA hydratase/isomerase family protein [Acidimicrobiales bacterium]|nr:enoyl-CoA hydratase/isomerase family protein [Acidimicrobiales bacterium]